jgi:thiol-disulfide isomerase/thioredoxin
MKNLIVPITTLILILTRCTTTNNSNEEPEIKYNQPAYIKIQAENVIDSIYGSVIYETSFSPTKGSWDSIRIKRNGTYYLRIEIILPDFVELNIGNNTSFQTYLIPGDTLLINLNQVADNNHKIATHYSITNDIYNYCQDKYNKFGFYEIGRSQRRKEWFIFNLTNHQYSTYCKEVDSLKNLNIDFLEHYRGHLPKWFIDIEKNNIIYNAATCKLLFFQSLTNWDQRGDSLIDVQIYNSKGRLSIKYQEFLYHYFLHGHVNKENLAGTPRMTYLYQIELPRINSLLQGEIKSHFLTMNLAKLYNSTRATETNLSYVDTLASNFTKDLSSDQLEFINKVRLNLENSIRKEPLIEGDYAPEFILKDINGTLRKLSDFKDKIIYLHFWATWCAPCLAEIPVLNVLMKDLSNDKVVYINICLDNKFEKWKKIIEVNKLMGLNLICDEISSKNIYKIYNISSLPHYTLINNGIILENNCDRPGSISKSIKKMLD